MTYHFTSVKDWVLFAIEIKDCDITLDDDQLTAFQFVSEVKRVLGKFDITKKLGIMCDTHDEFLHQDIH